MFGVFGARLVAGETIVHVGGKAGLAVFAVAGDIDSFRQLPLDHLRNPAADSPGQFFPVIFMGEFLGPHQVDDLLRTDQAAHMSGQDS